MSERVVLTTGANSGIGLETALEVARRGFRSVGSVRSRAKAKVLKEAAEAAGLEVETVILDVTDPAACATVIEDLKPYGLVNNAGFPASGAIEDVDDEQARLALETMVLAPARLARLALPHMRTRRDGRIINISSIAGLTAVPLAGWYHASKHALEALSDCLRMEVAADGVKVVLVEPGGFKTGIWDQNEKNIADHRGSHYEKAYQRALQGTRLTEPIMGHPRTVARVIADALESRRPNPRYLVGYDAQLLLAWNRLTPTALKDRLSRLSLGL